MRNHNFLLLELIFGNFVNPFNLLRRIFETFSFILSKRWFIYLGEISFGFYLIHQLVIRYVSIIFRRLEINLEELALVFIIFIITTLLSILSFEFFENRIRVKFKKYLTDRLKF